MKTYTESEVRELLRKQREICAKPFVQSIAERIRETPSPPTEEVGIKEDDYVPSDKDFRNFLLWLGEQEDFKWDGEFWNENTGHDDFEQILMVDMYDYWKEKIHVPSVQPKDLASLASHSCTIGNSIRQKTFCESDVEKFIRVAITETAKGCLEFFEKDSVIKDKDGNVLPDAWIHLAENPMPLTQRIYPRLEKYGIKFNSDKNVPVSDTTTDAM